MREVPKAFSTPYSTNNIKTHKQVMTIILVREKVEFIVEKLPQIIEKKKSLLAKKPRTNG